MYKADPVDLLELSTLQKEVHYILATYQDDPEGAHAAEDQLLEKVIRRLAKHDVIAASLLPLLDADREQ